MALQSAILPAAGSQLELTKSDGSEQHRRKMRLVDDNMLINQILETHYPAGILEVDVKPLFQLVEDILNRADIPVDASGEKGADQSQVRMDEKYQEASFVAMIGAVSHTIDRISCEILYNALESSDVHTATMSLLKMLSSYSWPAKLVLTLAAFALNYGEFWLLAQIYSSNHLAQSMAILKQLPSIFEHTSLLKSRFNALKNLVKGVINVTKCVVELSELPSMQISQDVAPLSTAMVYVPVSIYWIIRSVIACATQITILTNMGYEYAVSTTEAWELSTLAHKLKTINEDLNKQLASCYKHIEEKKNNEDYQMIVSVFQKTQTDNLKILKALIYAADDLQPLVDGSTKNRANLNVLRRKDVLLLISNLDISKEELEVLEHIHDEAQDHAMKLERPYEVVWIPIVDTSVPFDESEHKKFKSLQGEMPWYSVYHPNVIQKAVIKFIKEVWHFRNKPILVVIDPNGKVTCRNAIHMMWIWGSSAFPFTSSREEDLWKHETWRLKLLVDGIDPDILQWIEEDKYIFLYGGDDMEWIREFTGAARSIASSSRLPMEMIYVGKSSRREHVMKITESIIRERLSHAWNPDEYIWIWFFWIRLESMLFSKIQLNKSKHDRDHHNPHDHHDDDDDDLVMREIKKLLAYDKDINGWAVVSKGSNVIVTAHGKTILPTLLDYENKWRYDVSSKGFDVALKEYHEKVHGRTHPCCRLEFPIHAARVPDRMTCPECHRVMDKFTSFSCCRD